MKFWDASAIVPLLIMEPATSAMQALAARDTGMMVWWASQVECASAIARLERDGALDEDAANQAFDRLKQVAGGWHEVEASDPVREAAVRFLRVHPLRAADALQLGAAFIAADRRPSSLADAGRSTGGRRAQGRLRGSRQPVIGGWIPSLFQSHRDHGYTSRSRCHLNQADKHTAARRTPRVSNSALAVALAHISSVSINAFLSIGGHRSRHGQALVPQASSKPFHGSYKCVLETGMESAPPSSLRSRW